MVVTLADRSENRERLPWSPVRIFVASGLRGVRL
jgi:hypothetical protein